MAAGRTPTYALHAVSAGIFIGFGCSGRFDRLSDRNVRRAVPLKIGEKACVTHPIQTVGATKVVFGNHETGVTERFRDECEIHTLTQENRGETMASRIGSESWDAQFFGDLLQGIVAHAYDLSDSVRDGKHVGRPFGIVKQQCFRVAVVWVTPTVENIKHLRGDHRTDDLGATVGMSCLGTKKTDFPINYILIFKEQHVTEVDAVTKIGEEP